MNENSQFENQEWHSSRYKLFSGIKNVSRSIDIHSDSRIERPFVANFRPMLLETAL